MHRTELTFLVSPRPLIFLLTSLGACAPSAAYASGLRGEAPTVIGDARYLGLAGSALSVSDSVMSAIENPANAAPGNWTLSTDRSKAQVTDSRMNGDGANRSVENVGVLGSSRKFGLYVGHREPSQESDLAGNQMSVQETSYGAAANLSKRLAVGAAYLNASATASGPLAEGIADQHGWGWMVGANLKHGDFISSVAFRPKIQITNAALAPPMDRVELPWRLHLGSSLALSETWNLHGGLVVFGSQQDSIPLSAPGSTAGRSITLQPRLGLEWKMITEDFWALSSFIGTYSEPGRAENSNNRIHTTGGAALKLWAGRTSLALDRAPEYRNFQFNVGLDVLDLVRRLKIIPLPPEDEVPPGSGITLPGRAVPVPNENFDRTLLN
jgi:hypothetical protein